MTNDTLQEEDWNRISAELFTMLHRRPDFFGNPDASVPSHYQAIEETIKAMAALGYKVVRDIPASRPDRAEVVERAWQYYATNVLMDDAEGVVEYSMASLEEAFKSGAALPPHRDDSRLVEELVTRLEGLRTLDPFSRPYPLAPGYNEAISKCVEVMRAVFTKHSAQVKAGA